MCSLLLGSLPVGLVGCKDYDGDIKELDTTTSSLTSQVTALQTALDAAKSAADAAANDAKAAAAKADAATQEVALAKQAVEEAKAEAIQAALDEVKAANYASNDDLAALSGKLEGIETGLSKIEADFTESQKAIAELNKQISAMDVQIKALEKLKEDVASLEGLSDKVAAIDGITTELNAIKADATATKNDVAANKTDIAGLKTDVADLKSKLANVSSEISTKVTNAVNSIAGILAQRLTSVTLIPELYVGGVPTVEFETATYNKLVWKANKDLPAKGSYEYATQKVNGVDQYVTGIITNHAVEAKYRLNPATITASDIDIAGLSYVTEVATFKTRAAQEPKFAVSGAEIGENGVLTVKLDNLVPGKFREGLLNDNRYSTYEDLTASLRVPVAKKHLFENETEAVVYSEFVRLTEKAFYPYLGLSYQAPNRGDYYVYNLANNLKGWPYQSTSDLYNTSESTYVVKKLPYNTTYDLNELFIGIMGNGNGVTYLPDTIANSNLATYGLAIRYKVADGSYVPYNATNGVDQQKYVKLSGEGNSILTPQTPTGVTANQAIIGKSPILLAEMYDIKTGNIVDAEYFKVMFTAQEVEDITFTFPVTSYKGDACNMYYDFTWEYMTANLLEKLNDGAGMSQTEFRTIYGWPYYTSIDNNTPTAYVSNSQGNTGWISSPDVPAMRIFADENNLPALKPGDNALKYGNLLVFEPQIAGYPNIKVTINWTPTLKVTAATLGEEMATIWGTNHTMQIRVMPKTDTQTTAEYGTNILAGRIKPYVNNLLGCATYSINYAPTKEQDATLMKALNNYVGQPLEFTGVANGAMSKANQNDLTSVLYSLDKSNANARKLVCDGGKIKVNWTSNINGLVANNYNVGSIYLDVLPILKYTNKKVATITPALTPVSATMSIELLDAYGSAVTQTGTNGLWAFYGIESITYGATTDNPIKIGSGNQTYANATKLSDTVFDVTISGTQITFISNGYSVTTASKIYVPFVAKHAWGELKGYAVVDLKVTPGSN